MMAVTVKGQCSAETTPYFFGETGYDCKATTVVYEESKDILNVGGICTGPSDSLGVFAEFDSTTDAYGEAIRINDLSTTMKC